jgi:protein PhnA
MSIERIKQRSGSKCELCAATENLKAYEVLPTKKIGLDESIMACSIGQIETPGNEDLNHWSVLTTACGATCCSTSSVLENVEPFAFCFSTTKILAWAQATGKKDENKVIHRTATELF